MSQSVSSRGRWLRNAFVSLAILSTAYAQCMSLQGSTVCPDYNTYSIDIQASVKALRDIGIIMPSFTDVKGFDDAVKNSTAFSAGKTLCSAYNPSIPVRYQNTVLCASIAARDESRTCSDKRYAPLLCKTSCEAYAASFSEMVKTTCPSDPTLAETVTAVCSATTGWDSMRSTEPTCIDAAKAEATTCGFNTREAMCSFCKNATADPCCTTNAAQCQQTTTTAATSTASATTSFNIAPTSTPSNGNHNGGGGNKSDDTGLSTAAIGGIAGGGVGLVLLIALVFVCMRRSRRAAPPKSNLSRNISNGSGKYSISSPKLQEEGFSNIQIPMSNLPPVSKESAASAAAVGAATSAAAMGAAAAAGGAAAAASASGSDASKPSFCQAIYPYQASMADELDLTPGDIINVHRVFDDGWAVGTNLNTSAEGAFPVVCVTAVDENALDDDFEEVNMAAMTPMTLREEDQEGRRSPSGRNSPRSSLPSRPASPVHLPRRNSSIRDSAVIPTGSSPLTSSPLASGSSGGKLTPPVRDTMMSEASSINRWWDGEGSKQ